MISSQISAPDGHPIQTYVWEHPTPIGWIHICHGMAEHALRYDALAQALVGAGYSVVAHNHRGHGISSQNALGHYADDDGWQKVLNDVGSVREAITQSNIPYYLFGHSMGSFIVQGYLTTQPKPIDGLILSGSKLESRLITWAGGLAAKLERWRKGPQATSPLLDALSFGSFNKAFKPNRTEYDWLSRDNQEVDKYINDPFCGFSCTTQLWIDLLGGLNHLYRSESLRKIQPDLPILLFGGDCDPVGEHGKALPKLRDAYLAAGQQDVMLKLYAQGRHEMLNETNRQDVLEDILSWLAKRQQHQKAS